MNEQHFSPQQPVAKTSRRILKVCGMRDGDNIRAVESLGVDWMGFICWNGSSRYVNVPPSYLPARTKRVGVFVNPTIDEVCAQVVTLRLDLIQLHGLETTSFCHEVKATTGLPVIKAFAIKCETDLERTKEYAFCDYFIFDTPTPLIGGSGEQFDWSLLDAYEGHTPFLLSGGIGPADVERLRRYDHPRCIGFDVNSRFELSPARKDVKALSLFLQKLRS
jgi:phosphoribosylanthranilate isomerase